MHIPDNMLSNTICTITSITGAAGIGTAAYTAVKAKEKPNVLSFAAVTAFIFATQMLNFAVQDGTSGHLIGATLAAALLGVPFGILSMAIVLVTQCLVFADGGIFTLGANIVNMALIGIIPGALIHEFVIKKAQKLSFKEYASLIPAAWLSVVLAALACSIELSLSGTIPFGKVLPAMVGVHALIGIGEAIITIAAVIIFSTIVVTVKTQKHSFALPLIAAGIIALLFSPLASIFPDGLEWVAEKFEFLHESAPLFVSPLPDYSASFIGHEYFATGVAGLAGVIITFLASWGIGSLIALPVKK